MVVRAAAAADLRSFLAEYEARFPDDVLHISKPVRAEFEISAIATHLHQQERHPILIFEQVITETGEISPYACVINLLEDRNKLAFAIGSTWDDVALDWAKRVASAKCEPVVVSHGEAPSQEQVLLGDDIDVRRLPALRHHEMDPGHYITSGMLVTHDQETHSANMAFHRGFLAAPREIRMFITQGSHNALNLAGAWERNEPLKAAYWVGHHPAAIMGAHVQLGYRESHYPSAGALLGEPLRLVPSQSLGDDFLVPADAEFVIEGVIKPGHVDLEGPFGEYTRYYGPQMMNPVLDVTALTHRSDAMWHSFMVGLNNVYSSVRMERNVYAAVKRAVPQVQRVAMPVSGCGMFHVYVQMKKTHEGQPKQAIMAALGSSEWIKHVIVVDEDIDVYDEAQVLWAVATRSQWDRDVLIASNCFGSPLDPSGDRNAISAKGGIDATKPAAPRRYPVRVGVPEEELAKVALEDYVDPARLAAVPLDRRPRVARKAVL